MDVKLEKIVIRGDELLLNSLFLKVGTIVILLLSSSLIFSSIPLP